MRESNEKRPAMSEEFQEELREMLASVATPKIAYPIPEAGAAMGVSGRTVYRLIEDGELSTCQVNGRKVVPEWTIRDYLRRHESTKLKAAN